MERLSIYADLEIVINGDMRVHVVSDGGQSLGFHLNSLRDAVWLWHNHRTVLKPVIKGIVDRLPVDDMTIEIFVDNREIARIGADVAPSLFSRILIQTTQTELRIGNVFRVLLT